MFHRFNIGQECAERKIQKARICNACRLCGEASQQTTETANIASPIEKAFKDQNALSSARCE